MEECNICNGYRLMAVHNVEPGDYGHPENPLYSHVGEDFAIELFIPTASNVRYESYDYPCLEVTAWPCGGGSGRKRQNFAVPINYCPVCGRKLVPGTAQ